MKLRNKKTGEIVELCSRQQFYEDKTHLFLDTKNGRQYYSSLTELNEEWEDYEELETFWGITAWGDVYDYSQSQLAIKQKQTIGNYFETKEEAEKVVEKLKAWKRLKDKGFRFKGISGYDEIRFWFPNPDDMFENSDTRKDLDLLFGGEE